MHAITDFKDPKVFSAFVERMERGETTKEEEDIFLQALDQMSADLRAMAELVLSRRNE